MKLAAAALLVLGAAGCRCAAPEFNGDSAAEICVAIQACAPAEFTARFGGSLEYCTTASSPFLPQPGSLERDPAIATGLDAPLREIYGCLLAARGDCTAANRCWALSVDAGACTSPSGLGAGRCRSFELLEGCTLDGQRFGVDCAAYGAVCSEAVSFGSFSTCAVARCGRSRSCRGDRLEVCLGEALFLLDCARLGQRCEAQPDGGARCIGTEACDAGLGGRCEGSVSVACQPEGTLSRTDCAQNPTQRRCERGACVPTGTECVDQRPACAGQRLAFCQDGFLKNVDCVAAGFVGCDAGACVAR